MKNHPIYTSINNEIVEQSQAKLGVSDLSIQRGYGIFDFLKIINNRPIFIDDHLNRFYNSAQQMNLEIGMEKTELKEAVNQLMGKNDLPNSAIKIILTGGYSEDGYTMTGKPNLIITQVPFVMEDRSNIKGLKLVTYNHQRQLPTVKTLDYLQAIRLRPFVKSNNADDVLFHNNGTIGECPRANFFIVTGNEIITPKNNVLGGIVRSKVLKLKIDNCEVIEKNITLDDLAGAKEAFITSSTKNAYPVIAIDGKDVGDGKPGAITALINEKLYDLMHG
jgi:D-alanine transaminase/branched-chain amino acid aminotransferase